MVASPYTCRTSRTPFQINQSLKCQGPTCASHREFWLIAKSRYSSHMNRTDGAFFVAVHLHCIVKTRKKMLVPTRGANQTRRIMSLRKHCPIKRPLVAIKLTDVCCNAPSARGQPRLDGRSVCADFAPGHRLIRARARVAAVKFLRGVDIHRKVGAVAHQVGVADVVLGQACAAAGGAALWVLLKCRVSASLLTLWPELAYVAANPTCNQVSAPGCFTSY